VTDAASGGPAGLHPAPGPTSENNLPVPALGPSALDIGFGEDQRMTSQAPQVALVRLTAWWRAHFLVPGFGTSVMKFDEEGG